MNLVGKVARALASDLEVQNLDQWKSWIEDAQTVVDIVLEDAAKVAEDRPSLEPWELAAAIRALGEK